MSTVRELKDAPRTLAGADALPPVLELPAHASPLGLTRDGVVSGRPAGVVTGADGALYISDDNKGFIYRVSASQTAASPPGASATSSAPVRR